MIFPENVNNIPPISDNNNIQTLSKNKNKADKYLYCLSTGLSTVNISPPASIITSWTSLILAGHSLEKL